MALDYLSGLLQALIALGLVAGLAYLGLRFMPRSGGLFVRRGGRLSVEESVRIDARTSLVIVQVEGRRLLLATHGSAAPTLLTELGPAAPAERTAAAAHDELVRS